ncbi:THAP domain-containing protein 1-like [Ixodes scapularis]
MTGCSVPLCAASSAKGVRCFRFPQEKARRRKWESCIKRDRWKASHTSRICERHFEEDQYEMNRQDGRRLLKRTAVPTLFDFRLQPKRRKPPAPRAPPADRGGATTAEEAVLGVLTPYGRDYSSSLPVALQGMTFYLSRATPFRREGRCAGDCNTCHFSLVC